MNWVCKSKKLDAGYLSFHCGEDCRVTAVVVKHCRRWEGEHFGFELKVVVFLQEVSNKVIVLVLLDAAGAVADFSVRFYHCRGDATGQLEDYLQQ